MWGNKKPDVYKPKPCHEKENEFYKELIDFYKPKKKPKLND